MCRRRCRSFPKRSNDVPRTSSPTTFTSSGAPAAASSWSTICPDRRTPAAAELARPRTADVAGLAAGALPLAQDLHAVVERSPEVGGRQAVAGEKSADLVLERPLLIGGLGVASN
jgi:hypothetical protein